MCLNLLGVSTPAVTQSPIPHVLRQGWSRLWLPEQLGCFLCLGSTLSWAFPGGPAGGSEAGTDL